VKDQLLNDTGEELDEDGRVLRDKTWVAFKLEKINSYLWREHESGQLGTGPTVRES
jgi:hypothetical protein